MHGQDPCEDLKLVEGISSHTGYQVDNEDKVVQNQ